MRRPLSTFLVLWLVLVATAARADDLDDYLKARMTAAHLPGVSFAIVDDGKVARIGALGVSDVARATPATAETVYKIGSVSKQFLATAIVLLVQDGRLTVDDPVSRYLDGTPPEWQPITIRHLLTRTAGLVRESPAFAPMESKPDIEIVKAAYSSPLHSRRDRTGGTQTSVITRLRRSSRGFRDGHGRSSCRSVSSRPPA